MNNFTTKEITFLGVFSGIILFMSLVPAPWGLPWGYIPVKPVEATIIHIPVLVGVIYSNKRSSALFLGFVFGLGSLLAALFYQRETALLFYNPVISILPRMLFAYVAYELYHFLRSKQLDNGMSLTITFFSGTLVHTISVLGTIYLFTKMGFYSAFSFQLIAILQTIIAVNGLMELLLAVVVGVPVAYRLGVFRATESN